MICMVIGVIVVSVFSLLVIFVSLLLVDADETKNYYETYREYEEDRLKYGGKR